MTTSSLERFGQIPLSVHTSQFSISMLLGSLNVLVRGTTEITIHAKATPESGLTYEHTGKEFKVFQDLLTLNAVIVLDDGTRVIYGMDGQCRSDVKIMSIVGMKDKEPTFYFNEAMELHLYQ